MFNSTKQFEHPQAPCELSNDGSQWIVTICPYCGLRHLHGSDNGNESSLGHRTSHCMVKSPDDNGYILTLTKHMLDQIVRPITLSGAMVKAIRTKSLTEMCFSKTALASPTENETLWVKEPFAVVDDKVYYCADGKNNGFIGKYTEAKYMPRAYTRMYLLIHTISPHRACTFTVYTDRF